MLLRVDEYVAPIFFTKHILIIEGDTEEVVIKQNLKRLPKERYLKIVADFEIVKASGKATTIGLVKYLVAMGLSPTVIHVRDGGVAGAELFKPIADDLRGCGNVIQMYENVKDEIGYSAPILETPFKAYKHTQNWDDNWSNLPAKWRAKMVEIFGSYVEY